ncbi:9565_t:CDS:2 [Funneliformis geosporum]|nr:9565_t:CDS:2 [Funneliformis geosporum]
MILEEFHKNILMILEDAQILQYVSQELSDDYYNKVIQAINYDHLLGVTVFTDAIKTNVLAKKMAKKFTSPNPFKDTVGNMVNTSVLFLA